MFMVSPFIWDTRTLIGLLNNSVAGSGSPAPMGVDLICYEARLTSLLVANYFLIVHFMNFMQMFTWP